MISSWSVSLELDDITGAIVGEAIHIHREMGPGLRESVYERLLESSLQQRGLRVERQRPVALSHRGVSFKVGFRLDVIVEKRVIVEVKSLERLAPLHTKQLLTYLRLTDLRVGLLLNFGGVRMKDGIRRVVNDLDPSDSQRLRINR